MKFALAIPISLFNVSSSRNYGSARAFSNREMLGRHRRVIARKFHGQCEVTGGTAPKRYVPSWPVRVVSSRFEPRRTRRTLEMRRSRFHARAGIDVDKGKARQRPLARMRQGGADVFQRRLRTDPAGRCRRKGIRFHAPLASFARVHEISTALRETEVARAADSIRVGCQSRPLTRSPRSHSSTTRRVTWFPRVFSTTVCARPMKTVSAIQNV